MTGVWSVSVTPFINHSVFTILEAVVYACHAKQRPTLQAQWGIHVQALRIEDSLIYRSVILKWRASTHKGQCRGQGLDGRRVMMPSVSSGLRYYLRVTGSLSKVHAKTCKDYIIITWIYKYKFQGISIPNYHLHWLSGLLRPCNHGQLPPGFNGPLEVIVFEDNFIAARHVKPETWSGDGPIIVHRVGIQIQTPEDGKILGREKFACRIGWNHIWDEEGSGNAADDIEVVDSEGCRLLRVIHNLEWRTGLSVAILVAISLIVERDCLAFHSVDGFTEDADQCARLQIVHLCQVVLASEHVRTYLEFICFEDMVLILPLNIRLWAKILKSDRRTDDIPRSFTSVNLHIPSKAQIVVGVSDQLQYFGAELDANSRHIDDLVERVRVSELVAKYKQLAYDAKVV